METIFGSEVKFYEGNTSKPQRTLVVMTNAPLHSNIFEVKPSSGFATFPNSSHFSDRIIKWTAKGKILYLEERSLMNSIHYTAICLDFTRTGVIPGTSFEIFENGPECYFSLVVPTQSTIHRFYSNLDTRSTKYSILSQIDESFLDRHHASHVLLTNGRALRASVTQHPLKNTIGYCTAEGHIAVVTLLDGDQNKHEEIVLNSGGIFNRFFGGGETEGASDVIVLKSLKDVGLQKHASRMHILSDIAFSVGKDGWLRGWNVETQRAIAKGIDLRLYTFFKSAVRLVDDSEDEAERSFDGRALDTSYLIKGTIVEGAYLLTIAATKSSTGETAIHLVKMQKEEFVHIGSFDKYSFVDQVEKLTDFVLLELEQGEEERKFALTAMWSNGKSGSGKDYIVRKVIFNLNLSQETLDCKTNWFDVGPFEQEEEEKEAADSDDGDAEHEWKNEKSLEELKDSIFNLDRRHFEVVWRATQIQCANYRQQSIRSGNWPALAKYIEGYLDSPEFLQKYQLKADRRLRLNRNTEQVSNEAQRKFWEDLVAGCEELEQAAREPIGLAVIQKGSEVALTAVVHEMHFTIISEFDEKLYKSIQRVQKSIIQCAQDTTVNTELINLLEEVRPAAKRQIAMMKQKSTSGTISLEPSQLKQAKALEQSICNLTRMFLQVAGHSKEKSFPAPYQCLFNGAFAQSLIGARMRDDIENRLILAVSLQLLKKCLEVEIYIELDQLVTDYRFLSSLADILIVRDCAKISLVSWLPSDPEGLVMVRNEGGFEQQKESEHELGPYIANTADAGIRALLPQSETFLLAKKLVATKQFKILTTVLKLMNEFCAPEQRPAIAFYLGIACCGTDHPVRAMEQFEIAHGQLVEGNRSVRKAVLGLVPMSVNVPEGQDPVDSIGSAEFYFTTMKFLQDYKHSDQVVQVAAKSIDQLPADSMTMGKIASTLYRHLTSKKEWTNAFKLVVKTSGVDKSPQVRELLTCMLSQNEWESLATMHYGPFEDIVEDFLRDAASRQNASAKNHLYELLFSYYVARQEYRLAASTMYTFAKHIENTETMTLELLKKKRYVLSAVLNMQDVVSIKPEVNEIQLDDDDDNSLVFPAFDEENEGKFREESDSDSGTTSEMEKWNEAERRTKEKANLSGFLLAKRKKVVIVTQQQVEKEYLLTDARVALATSSTFKGAPPTEPQQLANALVEVLLFDSAFDVIRAFDLDTYNLFFAMAREAILVDAMGEKELVGVLASALPNAWTRQNRRHCNIMSGSEEHWDVVRGILTEVPDDSAALRGICTAFLSHQLDVPCWLHVNYLKVDVNDYLRCLVDYGHYASALRVTCHVIDEESAKLTSTEARTWLPYGVIDELIKYSMKLDDNCEEGEEVSSLRKTTEDKLKSYFNRVQSLEKAVKFT